MDMWDALIICPALLDMSYRIMWNKGKGVPDLMIVNPATGSGLGVSNSKILKQSCLNNF